MTYFGFALILGGVTVLLAMWREFGPRWSPAGARAVPAVRTGVATRARAGDRVTGDGRAGRRTAAARRRAVAARAEQEALAEAERQRSPVFHPRAEARRQLHAERAAMARAEAARQAEERAAAEALAAARAAQTWAGYGYSYGGAAPADPARRRPSPRRASRREDRPAAVPVEWDAPPVYRGTVYASAAARAAGHR
jgi:hypothetical protein